MASRPRVRTNALGAPSPPTTVGEQLEWATHVLEIAGAPEPAREAAALLASAMGLPSSSPAPDPVAPLEASQVDWFLAAIARRTRGDASSS